MGERDVMNYEVAIVGAGPAGLACALRLRQLQPERSVCIVEKAASLGAHSISGAVLDPVALDELVPDWRSAPPPTWWINSRFPPRKKAWNSRQDWSPAPAPSPIAPRWNGLFRIWSRTQSNTRPQAAR